MISPVFLSVFEEREEEKREEERERKTNSDFPMPTLVDPTIVETAAKEKGTNLLPNVWW